MGIIYIIITFIVLYSNLFDILYKYGIIKLIKHCNPLRKQRNHCNPIASGLSFYYTFFN